MQRIDLRRTSLIARVTRDVPHERHIDMHYNAAITGPTSMAVHQLVRSYTNLLAGGVKPFVIRNCHENLSVLSLSGSLVGMQQSIYSAGPPQLILRINVTVKSSGPLASFALTGVKRSILALPNQIDFVGSTAIIRRTLVLTYSALSSFSGANWQEARPGTTRTVKRTESLWLP